ncbi:hypothetical protein BPSOL_0064 [Bifidobacterium pseudolongum]|nr:hypothetical protein BPSOL_0064 [Bifidobacterium pseudolongum]
MPLAIKFSKVLRHVPLATFPSGHPSYALPSGFAVSVTVFAVIVINPAKK